MHLGLASLSWRNFGAHQISALQSTPLPVLSQTRMSQTLQMIYVMRHFKVRPILSYLCSYRTVCDTVMYWTAPYLLCSIALIKRFTRIRYKFAMLCYIFFSQAHWMNAWRICSPHDLFCRPMRQTMCAHYSSVCNSLRPSDAYMHQ